MSEMVKHLRRVIKVQPTMTADDNDIDDVAFDWTEIPYMANENGMATTLQSVMILDADDSLATMELVFCRGAGDGATAPTSAQGLIGGATAGSAAVDITAAKAQAINICGSVLVSTAGAAEQGDLILANILTATAIGCVLAPAKNSRTIYMGGFWRTEPAATGATGTLDIYLGFED